VPTNLASVRHQLTVLCKRKRARVVSFSPTRPCDWRPHSVLDPATKRPFTSAGAWDFIAEKLELGHPIDEVELDHPPGRRGYVLVITLLDGRDLYVKLELLSGCVSGRSFHYSETAARSSDGNS
jgi:hypothetical protein